ncbi:hypothetical protein GCM10023156_67480 [Novipirellula rosea]|uniref:Uncharacterized protein n=1 Tax=Novipirellula rosea TaxID=1031540 RepID=A0ABP8NU61_9BACT
MQIYQPSVWRWSYPASLKLATASPVADAVILVLAVPFRRALAVAAPPVAVLQSVQVPDVQLNLALRVAPQTPSAEKCCANP